MLQHYWSDTHFGHANILQYCQRPWVSIQHHDADLFRAWLEAQDAGLVVHLGDVWFRQRPSTPPWDRWCTALDRTRNLLVLGNHDKLSRTQYDRVFDVVHGTAKERARESMTWITDTLEGRPVRLLVSHHPQPIERFDGADYNLHGHIHNGFDTHAEQMHAAYPWLVNSPVHLNCAVERVGYRPRTLPELLVLRATYVA